MREICFGLLLATAAMAQTPAGTTGKELATLSGRTTGSNGQALRKSVVTLRPTGMGAAVSGVVGAMPQPYGATTDADGRFSFNGVEPGSYMLMVEHPGYVRTTYGSKKGSFSNSTIIKLAPGQQMTETNIELPVQSTISGRLLDEDGEPAVRAQVRVMRRMYTGGGTRRYLPVGNAASDENGDFKVTGLEQGKYVLSASPAMTGLSIDSMRRAEGDKAKPEEGPVTTYYPGTTEVANAVIIDVGAGQDVSGMNLKISKIPVFHIRGKASGAIPGEAPQRIRVAAVPRDTAMLFDMQKSAMLGKDGSFDISGVPPGSYTLNMMRMEGMVQTVATSNVNVGHENVEDVTLAAVTPADLTGVVRLEGDQNQAAKPDPAKAGQAATARATIRVMLSAMEGGIVLNGPPNATAKSDGSFVLQHVSPGKYHLQIAGIPPGGYLKSVKLGGRETIDSGLDLTQGTAGTLEITVSPNGGEVSGVVQDHDGKPAGGLVTLIPDVVASARPDLYRLSPVNDTGQFRLRGIAPGRYRIYAWAELEAGAQFDPDFMKLHENQGQPVTIEEGAARQVTLVQ